jgi:hypothetical protein
MVREAVKIAASEAAPIEMEVLWVRNCLPDPDLKLRKEILR